MVSKAPRGETPPETRHLDEAVVGHRHGGLEEQVPVPVAAARDAAVASSSTVRSRSSTAV
jgi:hypothetical protein